MDITLKSNVAKIQNIQSNGVGDLYGSHAIY